MTLEILYDKKMIDLLTLPLQCECHPDFTYKTPGTFAEHFYTKRHKSYLYERNLRELNIYKNRLDIVERECRVLTSRLRRARTERDQLQNQNQQLEAQLETTRRECQTLNEQCQTWKNFQQDIFQNMQTFMNSANSTVN